jgi:hypothetical protein
MGSRKLANLEVSGGVEVSVDNPFKVERSFGVVEIAEQRCFSSGCDAEPVASALKTRKEGTLFTCLEHQPELDYQGFDTYLLAPLCQHVCGEAATHLATVGIEGGELRPMSLCAVHAERFG